MEGDANKEVMVSSDDLPHIMNAENLTFEVKFVIKSDLRDIYPLFVFLHACEALVGVGGNLGILMVVARERMYHNPTFFFLANLAISDIIKSAIVLPFTFTNLLSEGFIFGSFMCYFLPMLHWFPVHCSMLTYLLIAIDRYRLILYPMRSRLPAGLCCLAVWIVSVCVVLPFAVYFNYLDFSHFLGEGIGFCDVNMDKPNESYVRGAFIVLFCMPLAVISFLYVQVSTELAARTTSAMAVHPEGDLQNISETSCHSRVTWLASDISRPEQESSGGAESSDVRSYRSPRRFSDDYDLDDIDTSKEKRTQKYLIAMVILFAMCWCPLHILTLANHIIYEDEANELHFDITFLTFTFFSFLSTCANPVLFVSWRMSGRTKDRLKGYFRFSNRRRRSRCRSTMSGTSCASEMYAPSPSVMRREVQPEASPDTVQTMRLVTP